MVSISVVGLPNAWSLAICQVRLYPIVWRDIPLPNCLNFSYALCLLMHLEVFADAICGVLDFLLQSCSSFVAKLYSFS